MSYPNNQCGSCSVWLACGEPEGVSRMRAISEYCSKCKLFNNQKFVRHIPTQCCYPLEDDDKTVIICGAHMTPEVDGKIFWEYVDAYVEKIVVPVDPFEAARKIMEELNEERI